MRNCYRCRTLVDESERGGDGCPSCADWAPFDPQARGARRLDAYYYSFEPTGVDAIDNILAAVAAAGKAFHNTDQWQECPYTQSESCAEAIQRMADEAAAACEVT